MPKVSIQALFNFLLLKMPSEWVAPIDTKKKKKKPLQAYQNTLEHALIFAKSLVNEHVPMNLVPLSENFSPH